MCTLAFLYSIPISTLGLCAPISSFTHFPSSHTHFPQHVVFTPPCAPPPHSLCPLWQHWLVLCMCQ